MRYLVVTALALLSWSWAQQYVSPRQTRVVKRNPQIGAITWDAQWVRIDLDEGLSPGTQPQRRITNTDFGAALGWLQLSQDADTVPITPNTLPDYAGDTLLANNAGQDIDPTISSVCNHSFFDSSYVMGFWISRIFGNRLALLGRRNNLLYYGGGGIAERYDITPRSGSTVYIKGIATLFFNNYNLFESGDIASACNTNTAETTTPLWNDGVYTIGYQLLDTIEVIYDVREDENEPPDLRPGSYPNEVVAEVTKPLDQVRIIYNQDLGQCVRQFVTDPFGRGRLERLDHAYFDTPVEISSPQSYYAAVRYDLYVPGTDVINDTVFGALGPGYGTQTAGRTCFTGDTNYVGRNMILTPVLDQNTSTFIGPNEWYPQYFLFSGRGRDLNFYIFPIIYEVSSGANSTPTVRNGSMAFSAPYPNPAVDCLHLNVESPAATTLRLTLYTSEGRLVRSWNRTLQSGTSTVAVDLEVPAGAYLLQAQSAYGTATFWVNVVK
jgi:hypothetical protein